MNAREAQDSFRDFINSQRTRSASRAQPEDRGSRHSSNSSASTRETGNESESEALSAMQTNHVNKRFSRSIAPSDPATAGDLPKNKYILPANHRKFDNATGPKGVISDASSYQAARANRKLAKKGSRMFLAFGSGNGRGDNSVSGSGIKGGAAKVPKEMLAAMRNLPSGRDNQIHGKHSSGDADGGYGLDTDEDEDEEDEFGLVNQWREQRRAELVGKTFVKRTEQTVTAYGKLVEVGQTGYLDAVERSDSSTMVVVYIYEKGVRDLQLPSWPVPLMEAYSLTPTY